MPRDPNKKRCHYRRAEDDPKRCPRQIAARRNLREPSRDKFEIAVDQGEVGARLISLSQC
jgi:hypothetical protein